LPTQTQNRKDEHIKIALQENVQATRITTGFEDVYLIHQALPEVNRANINLASTVFGHKFAAPIFLGAMTGGTKAAARINAALAEAAETLHLGMGVGSQRAAFEDSNQEASFRLVRKIAPSAFLVANLGAPQLFKGYGLQEAQQAVDMIEANALAIHLNPLQEAVQPEGETNFNGVLHKITELAETLPVPVIVKETGAGISAETATQLRQTRVAAIDVSGAGGTSWAAVEYHRAKQLGDEAHQRLGKALWDWGIPTVASLVEVLQPPRIPVIASGGIRSGTEIAKALALGASLASVSTPLLQPATQSADHVTQTLKFFIEELRTTMFLAGAPTIKDLQRVPLVILGKTAEWLEKRGCKPEAYARR
jgi:isopentenyl-diphosphate delta-isomerase